jgi:hypothetical protein
MDSSSGLLSLKTLIISGLTVATIVAVTIAYKISSNKNTPRNKK